MRILEYISKDNTTIKSILKNHFEMTSGFITKLKYNGNVILNNCEAKLSSNALPGDKLKIICPYTDTSNVEPINGPLEILYEDDDVLCVNKPAVMPTHPSQNHHSDTLANIVYYYLSKTNDELHIVTRLDNYTSGVVLIAKNSYSASKMCTKEYNASIRKEYVGICRGILEEKSGIIEAPIKRCDNSIIKRCISNEGKYAKTGYEVIHEFQSSSLIQFRLFTGRTHQIRVHMNYISHPLLNDFLYDDRCQDFTHFKLHCSSIKFCHPLTKEIKTVTADLPQRFFDDII